MKGGISLFCVKENDRILVRSADFVPENLLRHQLDKMSPGFVFLFIITTTSPFSSHFLTCSRSLSRFFFFNQNHVAYEKHINLVGI